MSEFSERDSEQIVRDALKIAFPEANVDEKAIEFSGGVRRRLDAMVELDGQLFLIEVKGKFDPKTIINAFEQVNRYAKEIEHDPKFDYGVAGTFVALPFTSKSDLKKSILRQLPEQIQLSQIITSDDLANPKSLRRIILQSGRKPDYDIVPDLSEIIKHHVFISYRRSDTGWAAGRLADYLKRHFDEDSIFFDTSNIGIGEDFKDVITKRITSSNIVIVVIGDTWLTVSNKISGKRRLDDENDFVRLEVSTALDDNLLVMPILIDDAMMPQEDHLPDDLKSLVFRNAGRLTKDNFNNEVQKIVLELEKQKVPIR